MLPVDLEFLAWNVIERALDGQRTEDSRIELKAVYPHPANRAARQLAGHANAARSDWILWVIGVDERSNTITGAEFVEHAKWLNEVKSNFEHADLAPQLLESLSLPVRDANKTIVALLFDTSRAPYVVVNERFGQPGAKTKVKWEVPWREGESTRSAQHADLIRILVPRRDLPEFYTLSGVMELHFHPLEPTAGWALNLELYIETQSYEMITVPHHKCTVSFEIERAMEPTPMKELSVIISRNPGKTSGRIGTLWTTTSLGEPYSRTLDVTPDGLIIAGPGRFRLTAASGRLPKENIDKESKVEIRAKFGVAGTDQTIPYNTTLNFVGIEETQETPMRVYKWEV